MFQLLTSQKNELFAVVQNNNFSPSDFEWDQVLTDNADLPVPALRCKVNRDFLFIISSVVDRREGRVFSIFWSPGHQHVEDTDRTGSWNTVIGRFDLWLKYLRREIETPDLWSTVSGDTELIGLAADQNNRPFTQDEQLQLKTALNESKPTLSRVTISQVIG